MKPIKLLFALLIVSFAAQSQLKYAIDTPWRRQVGWLDVKKGFTPPRGTAFPSTFSNLNLPTKGAIFVDTVLHKIGIWNGSSFTILGEGGGGIGTETDPVWTAAAANYYTKTQADSRYLQSYTETDPAWLADKPSYLTSAIATATYATAASVASKLNTSDTGSMLDPYKHWTFGYLTEAAADLRYTTQTTFNARNIFNIPGIDTAGIGADYILIYDAASNTFKTEAFPSRLDLSGTDSGMIAVNADAVVTHPGLFLWKGRADLLYPSLAGSYANPSWLTSLAWSKISGAPSFLTSVNVANINATGTPSATTYLRGDGTWSTPDAGSSGTPGGSSGQLQYNNAGSFAGAAAVTIEDGQLRLNDVTTPTAPAAGGIKIYSKTVANTSIPYLQTPDGVETAIQPSLFMGKMPVWVGFASGTTAPIAMGSTVATSATMGTAQPTTTNEWTKYQRKTYTTSTTAGNATGIRQSYTQFGQSVGGFFAHFKFGQTIALNGEQKFVGMCVSTGGLAGDASALVHMIGMGVDAADVGGNWYLMHNDGAGIATKIDLGTNAVRNTTDGYELNIYVAAGSDTYYVYIKNLATNTVVYNGSVNTNVPGSTNLMAWKAECRNGAVAAATNLHLAATYIQPL